MVLEHLFPEKWWEKNFRYAFLLAFVFSLVSIFIASQVFGANSGIVSVMFITLFLLPAMRKIFEQEEKLEEQEKRFTFAHLWQDNKTALKTYFGVFLGIYFAYQLVTFLLPQLGLSPVHLFREQLFLDPAIAGRATFSTATFVGILANNWIVLLVAFIFAVIWSDGALFFVAWNASAWGAIFGYRALTASIVAGVNPWYYLFLQEIITFWHGAIEGLAYILVAIAGAVISNEVIKKNTEMKNFVLYGALFFIFGWLANAFLRRTIVNQLLYTSLMIVIALALVYGLHITITNEKHKEVFVYNYWLFVLGIVLFILGSALETIVLGNSTTLQTIYTQSAMYGR